MSGAARSRDASGGTAAGPSAPVRLDDEMPDGFDMYQREIEPQLPLELGQDDEMPDSYDMSQREVVPQFPLEQGQDDEMADGFDMYQREIEPQLPLELGQVQLPLLIQGEPMLSPRGRRPVSPCGGRQPCPLDGLTDSIGSNLKTFPPGKPNRDNIGNICKSDRAKTVYGRRNLPHTGFSHLSRQGNAINALEEGFTACCRNPDKLRCAVEVWKKTLEDFCEDEFSVKTRHYHCCKKPGSERETCFNNEAPNPSYVVSAALQEISHEVISAVRSPRNMKHCPPNSPKCQGDTDSKYKLSDLAFPPGEPKSSNIQNICKLRKYRPQYNDNLLPTSGFGHYMRRAEAIKRMEGEFKKCCKTEDVACAHNGWKKVLGKYCAKEQIVKTKHHECCKKRDQTSMISCFASEAPFPEYDREVEVLDLGNVTEDGLQKLCGDSKLLTKQKQVPLLVSSLKEMCCALPQDEKLRCAAEQRESFIKTLCGPKKGSWKDPQDCCSKDGPEREQCFTQYLQNISMAVSQRTKGQ